MDGNHPSVISKIKNVYSWIVRQRLSDGRWHSKTLLITQLSRVSSLYYTEIRTKGLRLTTILKSFPIMSDVMACTLIGAIGDVERFSNYLEFKKYLGVALRSPCKWQ